MISRLNLKYFMLRISGIAVIITLWEVLPALNIIESKVLPRFTTVIYTLLQMFYTKDLFMHLSVSLWRVINGLIIAAFIGISLGIILASFFPKFVDILNPLLKILSQVNPFSLMPVFILFFGIGEKAKIAIVTWVCIWPILFNTITGVKNINIDLLKTALSMNIGPFSMIYKVILPAVSQEVFLGIRLGVQISFFMLIAGEMLGASAGLGLLLHTAGHFFDSPTIYASALVIVILGVTLNKSLIFIENGLFYWKEETALSDGYKTKKETIRLGKPELILIGIILIGILFIGSQEVDKANILGQNPMSHEHHGTQ